MPTYIKNSGFQLHLSMQKQWVKNTFPAIHQLWRTFSPNSVIGESLLQFLLHLFNDRSSFNMELKLVHLEL